MPVDLTEEAIRDALAVLGEHDPEAAREASAVLGSFGWELEGPLLLRRYDVQYFLWYELPNKWLVTLADKRGLARSLARLLDQLGGTAATYAEVCRSAETDELLVLWEREDPAARPRLRELLKAAGLEPPDTPTLAWGQVMGLEEASIRELVAIEIEEAIEDGRLVLGARDFRRRQAAIAEAALAEPWDGDPPMSRLAAIHAERVDFWLRQRHGRDERHAIVARAEAMVRVPPDPVTPAEAAEALAPALWLLGEARAGIGLTQTGALNRALVREVAERWPTWWAADIHGPPHRETDLALLCELYELLLHARLLRRERRKMLATRRGTALAEDPPALLRVIAAALLTGESFGAACGELAAALILAGEPIDASALAAAIHPAIEAAGWNSGGEPPSERHVAWAVWDLLRPAEAIGLLGREPAGEPRWRTRFTLAPAGRAGLTEALRARAVAPQMRF